MKTYYVYILSNQARGTLYIGVTGNLVQRYEQHITKTHNSFTEKYHLDRLVYIEQTESIETAITREKLLKQWRRQ
jgi:putative endonuclease